MSTLAAVWRVVFAGAVTLLFTVVLLTATAQQQVMTALGEIGASGIVGSGGGASDENAPDTPQRTDIALDYSSALKRVKEAEKAEHRIKLLTSQEVDKDRETRRLHAAALDTASSFDEAWAAFQPVAARLLKAQDCGPLENHPSSAFAQFTRCIDKKRLTPDERSEVDVLWPLIAQRQRAMIAAENALQSSINDLSGLRQQLAVTRTEVAQSTGLRDAFDEMDVLRSAAWSGAALFVNFPPVLLQILLALAAGCFGALLLTLVLAVYPRVDLQLSSGASFEPRILLGGLIAVCVYVVLSGGVAVLGGAPEFGSASANFMSFCAVCILAGMFSDRVAYWLSEKADAFFAKSRPSA